MVGWAESASRTDPCEQTPHLLSSPADRGGEQPLLHLEQLRGGVAPLPDRTLGRHHHRALGTEPVGQMFQLGRVDGGQLGAERHHYIGAGERGGLLGQPLGAGELVERPADRTPLGVQPTWQLPCPAAHPVHQPLRINAQLAGLLPPAAIQRLGGVVGLGRAGGMRHVLDELAGARLAFLAFQPLQLGGDLLVPLGERPHQLLGHAHDGLVAPPVRLPPFDPQGAGQLPLVGRPVDHIGGLAVGEQVAGVQGAPVPVGALGAVDDDQMGVRQRVTRAADAVGEPHHHQPRPADMLRPTPTRAGADLPVQVGHRLPDPDLMRRPGGPPRLVVAEAVEDGDVLDRPQHQIPPGHRITAGWAAELLTGVGVPPGKQAAELLLRADPGLAQRPPPAPVR